MIAGPGVADRLAEDDEDAGADDRADAERGQVEQADGALELAAGLLGVGDQRRRPAWSRTARLARSSSRAPTSVAMPRWPLIFALGAANISGRSDDHHGPAGAPHELERDVAEHALGDAARGWTRRRGSGRRRAPRRTRARRARPCRAATCASTSTAGLAGCARRRASAAVRRQLGVLRARHRGAHLDVEPVDADDRRPPPPSAPPGSRPRRRARARRPRPSRPPRSSASATPPESVASNGAAATFRPARSLSSLGPMPPFKLDSVYSPTADQPAAIDGIAKAVEAGARGVTLLGATGTGKTMTMAATIEQLQRPALILAHNKTLAAQLCNEFRTYFPTNAVEYFVSYYDYYQPEAYVPSKDLYIEKDSAINQEIDRLRHAATASLFARRDVVIVASVSAHLRPRLAGDLQRQLPGPGQGRRRRPRRAAAQARLPPVQPQRHGARARHVPRARGHAGGLPGLRGDGLPRAAVRRRGRAPAALRPADGRADRGRPRARRDLARHALQRQGGDDGARGGRDRPRAQRAQRRSSRPRASCSSPTACASARSTTWRCCARSASARGSRTTRGSSTAARRARARTA